MHPRRFILRSAAKTMDLCIMVVSFALAGVAVAFQSMEVQPSELLSVRLKLVNMVLFGGLLVGWHLIFSWSGLYGSRRLHSLHREILDVLKATSLGTIAILTAGFLFRVELITPIFVAVFWAASTLLTMLFRVLIFTLLRRVRRHGRNLRNVLIVGTNKRAVRFADNLRARPELGYKVIGFADDGWEGIMDFLRSGERLVADVQTLLPYLRENVVDEVVIALPASSTYALSASIIGECEKQGITVRFLTDLFNLRVARAKLELLEDEPVITLQTGAMEGVAVDFKRALDLVAALVLIIVQLPIFLLVAVLIKTTSRGPVFFAQERIGLGKRRFNLYKFRTMVENAEAKLAELEHLNEVSGPVFKITNDPRITPIGRFLRKTSLDEMPQLLNVLKGDMSLVGPRPLPIRDYKGFDKDWHRRRFSVRPGITCLWQVDGRSSIPFEKWMELDMKYIDEWSLWLDLKILVRTIPAVLKGAGAA